MRQYDLDDDSAESLRLMYSRLPKEQQNVVLAKSLADLNLVVYRMEQTNMILKYGITFIGIVTVSGWFLGPLLL